LILTKTSRFLTRLGRELDGPLGHFSEQFRYGHREILIAFARAHPSSAILGSIEHGWSPFGPSVGVPKLNLTGRYLHLAWSSAAMIRSGMRFPKNVIPIGAPFLYLAKLLYEHGVVEKLPIVRKYLFIPPHGAEDEKPVYDQLIEEYSSKFDPKETTVQLYWTEFLDPTVREVFEQSGFTVTTAGFCGMTLNEGLGISTRLRAIATIGGRHLFLLHIIRSLLTHQEIIMGTIGTSTLYAGYLGRRVRILDTWASYRMTATHEKQSELGLETQVNENIPFFNYCKKYIVEPFSKEDVLFSPEFSAFCAQELGERDMFDQESLLSLITRHEFSLPSVKPVQELQFSIQNFHRY
jgi:hypothetical protein